MPSRTFGAKNPVTRRNLMAARRVLKTHGASAMVKAVDEIVMIIPRSRAHYAMGQGVNIVDLKRDLDAAIEIPEELQAVGYMSGYMIRNASVYKAIAPRRSWGKGWMK